MTREELCIHACKYAIGELTRKGSSAFITSAHEGRQQITWVEVMEWLNREQCEDAISRKDILDCQYTIDENETLGISTRNVVNVDDILNAEPVQPKPKVGHWIPVKFRPLTDEEQEEYPDYCYMADYPMPDDGEEILVSTKSGRVEKDECRFDDGYYLDSGYDWQTDIVAWMPLPEPYESQESEDRK